MDPKNLADCSVFNGELLRESLELCEDLETCHDKITAMIQLLVVCNIESYPHSQLHSYNSIIDDFVMDAKDYMQYLRGNLSKIMSSDAKGANL